MKQGLLNRGLSSGSGNSGWKLGKLNHVAIAVPDLQKGMDFYAKTLGAAAKVSAPQVRIVLIPFSLFLKRTIISIVLFTETRRARRYNGVRTVRRHED